MEILKYILIGILFFPLGTQVLNVLIYAALFIFSIFWYFKGWDEFDQETKNSSLKLAALIFLNEFKRLFVLSLYYLLLIFLLKNFL